MNHQGTEFEGAKVEAPSSPAVTVFQSTILKEIRSWAITLLILGALHIVATDSFSAPWGILLILVGLASFYFRTSAMMVVYAVTLAWAGLSNITSGQGVWIGFALLQWFLVFRVFQKFLSFRQVEANSVMEETNSSGLTPKRSAGILPWVAGALGTLSLLGLVGVFVMAILLVAFSGNQSVPPFLIFIEGLIVNCGVLGFAVGLASVLCKYPRKVLSITGMVTGLLTLLIETILRFV